MLLKAWRPVLTTRLIAQIQTDGGTEDSNSNGVAGRPWNFALMMGQSSGNILM
jgi:hypothetical protein